MVSGDSKFFNLTNVTFYFVFLGTGGRRVGRFPCTDERCNKTYPTKFNRDRHFRKKHLGVQDPRWTCPVVECGREMFLSGRRDHEAKHQNARLFKCPYPLCTYATKGFNLNKNLVKHAKICRYSSRAR
jgi:hypothetical protein